MAINADKPHLWKADTRASVDQLNRWFLQFAPKAFRDARKSTVDSVTNGLMLTGNLTKITPALLKSDPQILPMLRMSACPPLARDRLIGLAYTTKNLVGCLEAGKLPSRIAPEVLEEHLDRIVKTLLALRDTDILPWITEKRRPAKVERYRASTIIADRLCGVVADPIVRNAQEKRQLALIERYLVDHGYRKKQNGSSGEPLNQMKPGTFAFRMNVLVTPSGADAKTVRIPIDAVIQPKSAKLPQFPLLIEAKSAGDFTNVNKRRKEEATKMAQLKATFNGKVIFILFHCGYFDAAYLGYEASEGIDWIWEHRIEDLAQLGV